MREKRHPVLRRLALGAGLAAMSCQSYRAQPLEPTRILETIRDRRAAEAAAAGEPLGHAQAVAALREHNPAVREARAAWATRRAVADVPTPLPNPSIDATTLLFGSGFDVLDSADRLVDVGLGWALPLGGRRRLTDEWNELRAEAAFVEAVGTERREYLALRRELVALAQARRARIAHDELAATVEASLETTRRLTDAGHAGALDVREMELELERVRLAALAARERAIDAAAAVAARTGLPLARIGAVPAARPPEAVPDQGALHELLLRDHPGLAARRAAYLAAEKRLRLEVARQFPSLSLGLPVEREDQRTRFGLALGIELPLFDRNRGGIAEARAAREEVRTGYEAEALRAISAIEAGVARLRSRAERAARMRERIAPAAERALEAARASVAAGEAPALQLLQVLRSVREVERERIAAEGRLLEAWLDLEAACGAPLLRFEKGGPPPEAEEEAS